MMQASTQTINSVEGSIEQFFRQLGENILARIHPMAGSLNTLLDPLNTNVDYNYAMQLKIIEGVCFGLALAFLLGGMIFAIGRFMYGGFGGREPSKFGYSAVTVWTNKLAYYFFGILALVSAAFGIFCISKMYVGIGNATDIYYATLPPLTNTQRQYMQRIIDKNEPIFVMLNQGNMTQELRNIWKSAVNTTLNATATKANFADQTRQIELLLNGTEQNIAAMRTNRISVAKILSEHIEQIKSKVGGISMQKDVETILQQFAGYYNFTPIDNVMRGFNISVTSLIGSNQGDSSLAFIGKALNQELELVNYIDAVSAALNVTDKHMQSLYDSLSAGTRRCKTSLKSGFSVPFGGAGMTKFTTLIEMLNPIRNIVIPILLVIAGILVVSLLVGGAAFPKRWHHSMYTIAFLFLFGIIALWALNGVIIPAAVVTGDTCADRTLFNNDTNVVFSTSSLSTMYVPTCAACDQNNVFKNWSDFQASAMKKFNEKFQVNQSLSSPVTLQPGQQVSGASVIFQTLKNIQTSLQRASVPAPQALKKVAWNSNIKRLRKSAKDEPSKAIVDSLEQLGNQLVSNTTQLNDNFKALQKIMSDTVKPISSIEQTMSQQLEEMQKTMKSAFKSMQGKLEEMQKLYQTVPADQKTQCTEMASTSFLNTTYSRFESALCKEGSAGLNGTWLTNLLTAVLLIPLVIVAIKAYKHLAFSNFFQDDYQAF